MTRLLLSLIPGVVALSVWSVDPVQSGGLTFHNETFHSIPFSVVWVDLEQETLQLFWKRPDGTPFTNFHDLRDWLASEQQELRLATNAGIYAVDRTPLGLHIEAGETLRTLNPHKGGKGNFALKPNGVFFIDDAGAHIVTTESFAAGAHQPELAVQSGPLLVIDGALHPKFEADSTSVNLRNGIGVISDKKIVIAIANWPVNLHTFASFFKDFLKCPNALYLDGTLSGLYAPALERDAPGADYVGILAVTRPMAVESTDE